MNKFYVTVVVLIVGFLSFWGYLETQDENYAASFGDTITLTSGTYHDANGDVVMTTGSDGTETESTITLPLQILLGDSTNETTIANIDELMGVKEGDEITIQYTEDSSQFTSGNASLVGTVDDVAKCSDLFSNACFKTQ